MNKFMMSCTKKNGMLISKEGFMDKTNCNIKQLELACIRHNKVLSITTMVQDVERCAKTIREYGLLTPLIVRPCEDGGYMVIAGECELKALQEVGLKKTEAVVVKCRDDTEADKLSLLLCSLKQDPTPLSEGLILQKLIKTGSYSQADIAHLVGKSVSWVSKRLTLIERLNESVIQLVRSKKLSCHTAQEIARLPEGLQLEFASKVIRDSIPKSKVEKLVVAYNNPEILESLKVNILENPREALELIAKLMPEIKRIRRQKKKKSPTAEDKLYSALKVMIKIIGEIELSLAAIETHDRSKKLMNFLHKTGEYALRFYQLTHHDFSPGKTYTNESEGEVVDNQSGKV